METKIYKVYSTSSSGLVKEKWNVQCCMLIQVSEKAQVRRKEKKEGEGKIAQKVFFLVRMNWRGLYSASALKSSYCFKYFLLPC